VTYFNVLSHHLPGTSEENHKRIWDSHYPRRNMNSYIREMHYFFIESVKSHHIKKVS